MDELTRIRYVPPLPLRPTSMHVTLAVALAVMACACSRETTDKRSEWNGMVSSAVHTKAGNAGSVYIDFRKMLPFDWDRVIFFPPYSTHDDIYDALGFRWRGVERASISERDDITLVVFAKGRRVVHYIEHPRVEGDFSRLRAGYAYTAEEAYFEVVEEGLDDAWLVIQEASRNGQ